MRYAAILFDLDGTLVDTIATYEKAVIQSMAEIGIALGHEEFFEWFTHAEHLKALLARYGLTESDVPELRGRRDFLYKSMLRTEVKWLPGGEAILQQTFGRWPVAIVTGSWRSYVDAIDERLRLTRYTRAVITADEIHKFMKPHPHGLLLAADRLGVEPEKCLYIGDQAFDTEAAHRAGMPCCIVPGAYSPANVREGADFVCERLEGAMKVIAR